MVLLSSQHRHRSFKKGEGWTYLAAKPRFSKIYFWRPAGCCMRLWNILEGGAAVCSLTLGQYKDQGCNCPEVPSPPSLPSHLPSYGPAKTHQRPTRREDNPGIKTTKLETDVIESGPQGQHSLAQTSLNQVRIAQEHSDSW